ncbi:MAG: pilus assembly protein, partial [Chloroflexi bacterium]|nr:pilus assembly protein [Chloroflexota bacterium]
MKPAIAATRHKLQVSEMRSGRVRLFGKLAKRFARREGAGGQGMVEFALILPLILLLISAIVEFGRMLTSYTSVS